MDNNIGHWTGPFTEEEIQKHQGFVYLIRNQITNKMYIGRKYTYSLRKVPGKKRKQKQESNWREYTSSSDEMNEAIAQLGKDNFHFEILSIHKTRGETNYEETRQLYARDVLYQPNEDGSDYQYANKWIASSRRFRK